MRIVAGRLLVVIEVIIVFFLFLLAVIPRGEEFEGYRSDLLANYNYCYTDQDAANHKKTKDCQGFLYTTLNDPISLFTGLLVVATVALFIVTYWLFQIASREGAKAEEALIIARDSAAAAQKSAEAAISSERAYIEAIDFKVLDHFFETDIPLGEHVVFVDISVAFTLKNFGKTPGLVTNFAIDAAAGKFAHAEFGPWIPRFDINGIVLGERESHIVQTQTVRFPTTGLQVANFVRGNERLHVRIVVEYSHVFDASPKPSMNYWQYIKRADGRHWVRHQNQGAE